MFLKDLSEIIHAEQSRQQGRFINSDIDEYINKIYFQAELIPHYIQGDLAGLIAFYCNNQISKEAFITSIIVDPKYRGIKISINLVNIVKSIALSRGFTQCKLQVHKDNEIAINLYKRCGFEFESESLIDKKLFMICKLR